MKRLLISAAVLALTFWALCPAALAHVLKTDGSVGVTVHINPDDAPLAGQSAQIFVSVNDNSDQLNLATGNCRCTATIGQQGSSDAPQSFPLTGSDTTLQFAFAKEGNYAIVVSGKPAQGAQFPPFTVNFSYYVRSPEGATSTSQKQITNAFRTYAPFVTIFAGCVMVSLFLLPVPKITEAKTAKNDRNVPKPRKE